MPSRRAVRRVDHSISPQLFILSTVDPSEMLYCTTRGECIESGNIIYRPCESRTWHYARERSGHNRGSRHKFISLFSSCSYSIVQQGYHMYNVGHLQSSSQRLVCMHHDLISNDCSTLIATPSTSSPSSLQAMYTHRLLPSSRFSTPRPGSSQCMPGPQIHRSSIPPLPLI